MHSLTGCLASTRESSTRTKRLRRHVHNTSKEPELNLFDVTFSLDARRTAATRPHPFSASSDLLVCLKVVRLYHGDATNVRLLLETAKGRQLGQAGEDIPEAARRPWTTQLGPTRGVNVYARRGRARRRTRKCLYERVFLAGPRARARRSGYLVSYTGAPEEGRDAGPMKGGLPLPSNVSGRDRFGRGVRAPVLLKGLARALRPRTGPNQDREDR